MRLTAIVFLVAILFVGCSGGETTDEIKRLSQTKESQTEELGDSDNKGINKPVTNSESIFEIQFQREAIFGSTGSVIVGKIASFAVDDQNRVFIADIDQTAIHVFNPDGSFLTSLGRQGKGPAEFAAVSPNTIIEVDSNFLYVPDYPNPSNFFPTRVQIFRLDNLSFSHTMKLIARNRNDYDELKRLFPKQIYPRNKGEFMVAYRRFPGEYKSSESYIRYVIQDSMGNIISEPIFEQKDLTYLTYLTETEYSYLIIHSFPFSGKSLLAISNEGKLFAAWSQEFKIDVYNPNGEYRRTFQYPFKNVPLTRSGLIDRYEKKDMSGLGKGVALNMIREAENLPETWPALQAMFFDDQNRLWISTFVENDDIYEWWILKKIGEVITKFKWPRDKAIKTVKNGYLYTRETDEMGVSSIVKYKIEME